MTINELSDNLNKVQNSIQSTSSLEKSILEPRFISLVIPNDRAVKTVIIVRPLISTHTKLRIVYPLGTEKLEPILPTKMSILTGKKYQGMGTIVG